MDEFQDYNNFYLLILVFGDCGRRAATEPTAAIVAAKAIKKHREHSQEDSPEETVSSVS